MMSKLDTTKTPEMDSGGRGLILPKHPRWTLELAALYYQNTRDGPWSSHLDTTKIRDIPWSSRLDTTKTPEMDPGARDLILPKHPRWTLELAT